jgi:tryptophan-rich sensory protein
MNSYTWYQALIKPSWAPPSWVFGPAWSFLYILIFISFGTVLGLFVQQKISWIIALPFALNIVFNLAFTPLQFTLRSNVLASIDIILVLLTIVWAMWAIYPIKPWIAYMQIPYLCWVLFATVLQLTITYLNIT